MKGAAVGVLLVSLFAGSAAWAGDSHPHSSRHEHRSEQRHHGYSRHDDRNRHDRRHDKHHARHDSRHVEHRRATHHHHPRWDNGRYHWGQYHRPHGYAARHWRRGDRLPRVYYAPTYVIHNYGDCGLRHPPRGHHWIRVNNDAVLAVIATGVVLDVFHNRFW